MNDFNRFIKKKMKFCLLLAAGILLSISLYAQQITLTGTVSDHAGETLPGVSIMVKGTSQGTATDVNGAFSISVSEDAVLIFSFVGYSRQEIIVGEQRNLDVRLTEIAVSIDEYVVIGYGGSQIRKNLTGSVGSVSGAALERIPVASAAEALVGKVAGVQVSAVDGAPGSEINIRIRGGTSITQSNQPLFIVDGFPANNINDIPPTDIQSIDILKDASLTAIYGARGGNGVVIVTTKAARAGKITVNFNHTTQVRTLARKLDLMTPYEHAYAHLDDLAVASNGNRIYRNFFGSPSDADLYKRLGNGNDWQDEILGGKPLSYMYNLTIGGGQGNFRFNTSITHNDENGILVGSGVKRTNVNSKFSIDITPNLKIMLNPRLNFRQNMGEGAEGVGADGIIGVLKYRPSDGFREFSPVDKNYPDDPDATNFKRPNPKGDIAQNYKKESINEFQNMLSLEWKLPFLEGLTFRSDGMISMYYADKNQFWGYLAKDADKHNNLPRAEIENRKRNRYSWANTLNYGYSYEEHNFSVLIGQEIQHTGQRNMSYSARYFPQTINPETALENMGIGSPWRTSTYQETPDRTTSFFGSLNYNYKGKYLLGLTYRADGSTKFAPGNQWGHFPAVSGGWLISNEEFMNNVSVISFLKLRAAIGMAGNNRIDDDLWRYQYIVASADGPGFADTTKAEGDEFYVNALGDKNDVFFNPKIKWETTLTRNFALDINLFNDRLSITPEVYWNTTFDLLYQANINSTIGYTKQMQNIGQVTNRGYEFAVSATIVDTRDFYIKGNIAFGANKTRVDKLDGTIDPETGRAEPLWTTAGRWSSSNPDYCVQVGKPIGLIYGYEYDGIYQFDEFTQRQFRTDPYEPLPGVVQNTVYSNGTLPGKMKFKNHVDGNADDPNDDRGAGLVNLHDRVEIGNTNPQFSGGFGFQGAWKYIDFSVNFTYMYKFSVNNATRYDLSSFEKNNTGEFKFVNLLSEFNLENGRWRYASHPGDFDDPDPQVQTGGLNLQTAARDNWWPRYEEINANARLFHPRDITSKVTHSYFIEDGSFLRLQDVTVGYTLPKEISRKLYVERLRVYFSGYNLFLWTNYSGFDPEVDVQSGLTPGIDYNRYPRSRNFVFGVNLSF